jgi:3-ketosteroid 9alpha-monooxygenase subunit A
MAKAAEYSLGPQTFPRGWFIVAESSELDDGPLAVRFFGQDFALYRGESGRPVMLDAYCAHMGTHLTASRSAMIVQNGEQIEGDSIRCPYHGWRYAADGQLDNIPYHDGPLPKSAAIKSYDVRDVMGCVMMWFDPEGGEPDYEPPCLKEWDDPSWIHWKLDHLGELAIHGQEILDNMADAQHLGPTHGAPCEYFENEINGHICIQRQGGFHQKYDAMLTTTTWYTGPGVLLSKQAFGEVLTFELIANTPVDDGVSRVWHAALAQAQNVPHSEEDIPPGVYRPVRWMPLRRTLMCGVTSVPPCASCRCPTTGPSNWCASGTASFTTAAKMRRSTWNRPAVFIMSRAWKSRVIAHTQNWKRVCSGLEDGDRSGQAAGLRRSGVRPLPGLG